MCSSLSECGRGSRSGAGRQALQLPAHRQGKAYVYRYVVVYAESQRRPSWPVRRGFAQPCLPRLPLLHAAKMQDASLLHWRAAHVLLLYILLESSDPWAMQTADDQGERVKGVPGTTSPDS